MAASPATPRGADKWIAVLRSSLPAIGRPGDECYGEDGKSYPRQDAVSDVFGDAGGHTDLASALDAALGTSSGVAVAREDSRDSGFGGGGTASGLGGLGSASPPPVQAERVRAKVRIDTAATQWTGSEDDTEQVQRSLRRYTGRFKHCYERALGDLPSSKGRLVFAFEAPTQGGLTKIELTEDDSGHEFLADCVHNALQRVRVSGLEEAVQVEGWALHFSTE